MKAVLSLFALVAYISTASVSKLDSFSQAQNSINVLVPRLTDTRIVGGHVVSVVKHPHQVSLRFKNFLMPELPFQHRCGGSIQSDRIIVTAAHCVIATVPSQFQIVAGTNNRRGNDGFIAPVQDIIMHEGYNSDTFDNDIAILVLGTPLPLNNFTMRAIELSDQDIRNGIMSTVTGWGTTTEGGSAPSELQEVQVPIVSNEICNEDYEGMITDSMLCAGVRGVGGKDACQGDSGGPLVVNGKLAGVVSWGYGCARPQFPGVYAKVSHLHGWLMEKINKNYSH